MNWLQFAVQWVHVLLGILWFGYALSAYFLIAPPLRTMPEGTLREMYGRLSATGQRVFPVVGILVLLLGIVRGTLLGPINSFEYVFTTAYGLTWLLALVATIGLFVNGAINIGPAYTAVKDAPDFGAAVARLNVVTRIDLALFFVIFTCMILMRFGY
ncbi:MAG TPA: hypothetical protein VH987_01710 [Candidatus Limnocylindria bacterium]